MAQTVKTNELFSPGGLACFTGPFKLKHEDSENIKADSINSHFQLISNQTSGVFLGHPVCLYHVVSYSYAEELTLFTTVYHLC